MARLHEYQGKQLLEGAGIPTPRGELVHSPEGAKACAAELASPVVVKAQVWITHRKDQGLIKFAATPEAAFEAAASILGRCVDQFTVDAALIEEQLAIEREFYVGVVIDDEVQSPVVLFSSRGGTGIEEMVRDHPEALFRSVVDVRRGFPAYAARDLVRKAGIGGKLGMRLGELVSRFYQLASQHDARAAEINPLILTPQDKLVAADCRITIDDYAVYRRPELGIEVAREFNRPPTRLEEIAWEVEKGDYRGTFYFIQLEQGFKRGEGVIGFHGAGGGGSMMSMDALLQRGYRLANFVDTSGNPPASKVYRAARLILAQPGIDGYFASGSGVASQEQFHSARGLVKAFLEVPLQVPAVIRLGGNRENLAIHILERARPEIPAPLEAYGKDDPPEFCAGRLDELIRSHHPPPKVVKPPPTTEAEDPYRFPTVSGGEVLLDHARCQHCESKVCVDTCVPGILSLKGEVPVLNITLEEAEKGGCTECLACEVECHFEGNDGGRVILPIPGLHEWVRSRS